MFQALFQLLQTAGTILPCVCRGRQLCNQHGVVSQGELLSLATKKFLPNMSPQHIAWCPPTTFFLYILLSQINWTAKVRVQLHMKPYP